MKEKGVLFAIASKNGRIINQHFGHADRFLVYQATTEGIDFLEEREVSHYCLGEETYSHPFEQERFMSVANTIKDCQYLLVSRIGTIPEKRLKELGILSVMMYERIEDGIRKVFNQTVENETK